MAGLNRPTNVSAYVVAADATALTCDIGVTWSIDEVGHPGPYTVTLQYRTDSGTWSTLEQLVTDDSPTTEYLHEDVAANHRYGYRVYWYCADCGLTSSTSAEGSVGCWLVAPTETITLTDTLQVDHDPTSSEVFCYDTITLTDTLTLVTDYAVSPTDTITLTDTCIVGSTLKTNYAFYLGTIDGDIHKFSGAYYGDGATAILTRWRSKETDFSDQYPQYLDHRKMVDKVMLKYVDKSASTPVIIKVSTDGGVNWTTRSASVGTGDGAVKEQAFWFNLSGKYFQFEIECSSASAAFQWIALEPQFVALAENWEA